MRRRREGRSAAAGGPQSRSVQGGPGMVGAQGDSQYRTHAPPGKTVREGRIPSRELRTLPRRRTSRRTVPSASRPRVRCPGRGSTFRRTRAGSSAEAVRRRLARVASCGGLQAGGEGTRARVVSVSPGFLRKRGRLDVRCSLVRTSHASFSIDRMSTSWSSSAVPASSLLRPPLPSPRFASTQTPPPTHQIGITREA